MTKVFFFPKSTHLFCGYCRVWTRGFMHRSDCGIYGMKVPLCLKTFSVSSLSVAPLSNIEATTHTHGLANARNVA